MLLRIRCLFVSLLVILAETAFAAAPGAPNSPDPADGSSSVSSTVFLKWSASDATTFSVEFDTVNPPAHVAASGLGSPNFGEPALTKCQKYFWRVTAHNAEGDTQGPIWSFVAGPVCPQTELNDENEKFQLVGGVEESGFSSLGANTNAFLQAFTESPANNNTFGSVWGRIRLLGAPQQATNGIVSTFTDPTGSLQKQDFSKVGQAIDFVAGFKIANLHFLKIKNSGTYSVNPVFGAGFTTPLNSQDVVLRYLMPDPGTIECQTLQSTDRFGKDLARLKVTPGTTSCLIGPDGKTGITQLAFSNQDRSNFLGKWGVGIRTTTRFKTSDDDPQRGIVDFVIGQDASVAGGMMRKFVLKLDGVHPLPIGGEGGKQFLYLFGSASIRLTRNKNLDPLILKTVDPTVASPAIPSPEVVVLPLRQADRDFYRIGIALDLKQIFTKLAGQ